jgi:hypothetical protein
VCGSSVSVFICDLCVRWLCDACVWLFLVGIASYFRVSLCVSSARFRVPRRGPTFVTCPNIPGRCPHAILRKRHRMVYKCHTSRGSYPFRATGRGLAIILYIAKRGYSHLSLRLGTRRKLRRTRGSGRLRGNARIL